MKGVDKYVETAAARGKPMNDTRDGWKYLADMYAIGMIQQEEEIQELKQSLVNLKKKNHKLNKRIERIEGGVGL